jgi:hypothetical protein
MNDDKLERINLPWRSASDEVGCNFAFGDLVTNLPRRLTVDGRIHAPTLLAASGAIAGYAAQQTLFSEIYIHKDPGALQRNGIQIVGSKPGSQYFFGDLLNARLVSQGPYDSAERLWSLAAGAAVQCGVPMDALPKPDSMFAHVSRVLGSPEEGFPSLPEVRPQAPVKELMKVAWPLAKMCFNGELSGNVIKPPVVVTYRWRPAIAAVAAHRFIRDAHSVVPAEKALIVLFESAIYASKLNFALG